MHQTVNAIMKGERAGRCNHHILTLATHSCSPSIPLRTLSTSKGHHPSFNHTPFSSYLNLISPPFSPHGHLMFTSSISTSWFPYPPTSCLDLNPCELCQDHSFNHHSLFHLYISSQADHNPCGSIPSFQSLSSPYFP